MIFGKKVKRFVIKILFNLDLISATQHIEETKKETTNLFAPCLRDYALLYCQMTKCRTDKLLH